MGDVVKFRDEGGGPRRRRKGPRRAWRGAGLRLRFGPVLALLALAVAVTFYRSGGLERQVIARNRDGVRVIDGDTMVLEGETIRLFGIDAPEADQTCRSALGRPWPCGEEAQGALAARIRNGQEELHCTAQGRDRHGRTVAVCFLGATDLNEWLVSEGHAVADRHRSQAYVDAEGRAKAARKGLWSGTFVMPEDWRKGKRG